MEVFDEFAAPLVESGRYANPAEVMKAAMDALMREECSEEAKTAYLEQALEEGDASGVYNGDPFTDIRRKYGLEPRA